MKYRLLHFYKDSRRNDLSTRNVNLRMKKVNLSSKRCLRDENLRRRNVYLSLSEYLPVNPFIQVQLYESKLLRMHFPPLMHGSLSQELGTGISHNEAEYPRGQSHENVGLE